MMFGTRDEFDYVECAGCGCLQIATPPANLEKYYPPEYYSLADTNGNGTGIRGRLNALRIAHLLGDRSFVGRLLTAWRGYSPEIAALARIGVRRDASILDVGCGRGALLRKLAAAGFTRLRGVDAFVPDELRYADGVTVSNAPLEAIEESYDVVMLHHSLEHMPDPHAALASVRKLLSPGGVAIVRTPVADSNAWRMYRADWVQLDAPRHLVLQTRRSMCIVAERAGLAVTQVVDDSMGFQFWMSELYKRDIPLYLHPAGGRSDDHRLPRSELRRYDREARELNERQLGDQACFYLRRASGQ